ncbi:MAG: hypothetical protein ACOCQQ_02690 [Candidatus Nanoarchaeia archaeon]
MNIHQLADLARNSLFSYCMLECKGYCCRKGFLLLTEKELILLTADKRKSLQADGYICFIQEENVFSLNLANSFGSCPQLKDSKCMVHNNSNRPKTCSTFPIFVNEEKKEIRLSSRCYAIQENKLYPYIAQFKKLGFTLT